MPHTNKKELLSARLLIKYASDNVPTKAEKKILIEAASEAASIMRSAVWKMDRLVLFNRPESYLSPIVDEHFRMGGSETKKERTRHLAKVRSGMLTLSFQLNTGLYLIDVDSERRPPDAGGDDFKGTRGYVTNYRPPERGPIHPDFDLAGRSYSPRGLARIIIHEASHRFQFTRDKAYNYNRPKFEAMTVDDALNNADSWAYAALSIDSKSVESSATMVANGHHGQDHS